MALLGFLHGGIKVLDGVAHFLLNILHNLVLSGGGKAVASVGEDFTEVLSQVSTGKVDPLDGMGE